MSEATIQALDPRPYDCRFRAQQEGRPYPRSSCTACGKTILTGLGRRCAFDGDEITTLRAQLEQVTRERDEARASRERITQSMVMVLVDGVGYAAPKPVADALKRAEAALAAAQKREADVRNALIKIRRRSIFGPDLTTGILLDITAIVAGESEPTP